MRWCSARIGARRPQGRADSAAVSSVSGAWYWRRTKFFVHDCTATFVGHPGWPLLSARFVRRSLACHLRSLTPGERGVNNAGDRYGEVVEGGEAVEDGRGSAPPCARRSRLGSQAARRAWQFAPAAPQESRSVTDKFRGPPTPRSARCSCSELSPGGVRSRLATAFAKTLD